MAEYLDKDKTEKEFIKLSHRYFDRYYADKTDLESRTRALGYDRAAGENGNTIAARNWDCMLMDVFKDGENIGIYCSTCLHELMANEILNGGEK